MATMAGILEYEWAEVDEEIESVAVSVNITILGTLAKMIKT